MIHVCLFPASAHIRLQKPKISIKILISGVHACNNELVIHPIKGGVISDSQLSTTPRLFMN